MFSSLSVGELDFLVAGRLVEGGDDVLDGEEVVLELVGGDPAHDGIVVVLDVVGAGVVDEFRVVLEELDDGVRAPEGAEGTDGQGSDIPVLVLKGGDDGVGFAEVVQSEDGAIAHAPGGIFAQDEGGLDRVGAADPAQREERDEARLLVSAGVSGDGTQIEDDLLAAQDDRLNDGIVGHDLDERALLGQVAVHIEAQAVGDDRLVLVPGEEALGGLEFFPVAVELVQAGDGVRVRLNGGAGRRARQDENCEGDEEGAGPKAQPAWVLHCGNLHGGVFLCSSC